MENLIPPFEFQRVVLEPWTQNFGFSFWIVLMGFLVTAACGLVGNFLLLRRMALVGDAISHSVLPGLILAFVVFRSSSTPVMFLGAMTAGLVTVLLIEFIHRQSRVKPDAAICIAFTTLFAFGVAMMSSLETQGPIHIDAECVLYGEIAFVPLEPPVELGGVLLGPMPVVRMAGVLLVLIAAVILFYKELVVTSFDPGLARSLGMRTAVWHYGLMGALAVVIVGAFESVGAILAVAMLIVPPMFASLLSNRLPVRFLLTGGHAFLSALIGYHLSVWLECSAAGAMVVAAAGLFVLVWIGSLLGQALRRQRVADEVAEGGEEVPVGSR